MFESNVRRSSSSSRALLGASLLFAGAFVAACSGSNGGEDTQDSAEQSLAQACASNGYQAGAHYNADDRVTVGGKAYQCKAYPYSGWCSLGGAYAPGSGSNWQDAWTEVGSCTGGSTGGGGSCNATPWQAGKAYKTGDVVSLNGSYYVASHENPGYDPTISTWFWDAKTGCTGGGTSGGGTSGGGATSCNATAWQAGKAYKTGDIVSFNGAYYIAEHENPGYDPTISTWFWDPYKCGGSAPAPAPAPAPTPNPPTGGGSTGSSSFEKVISRSVFESMFPSRNAFYTYDGLVQATKTYPAFASTGTADDQKREVAAFLANVNHETGALVYVEEIEKADYCDNGNGGCPCAPGKRYFGRGPIQISWNYNYCSASQSIFGDKEVLRTDPDRVARESWVAWATGLFYWMTSTGAGSMTCHNAMASGSQFGETIRTINGGLECNGRNPAQVQSRVDAYVKFCSMLGVAPGSRTSC